MFRTIGKKLSVADIILILLILFAIGLSMRQLLSRVDGKTVYVYKEDRLFGTYPLERDRIVKIDEHNSLQIKNAKVRMLKADCPDQRCIKQGASGILPIICLPNKVSVEVRSHASKKIHIVQ